MLALAWLLAESGVYIWLLGKLGGGVTKIEEMNDLSPGCPSALPPRE